MLIDAKGRGISQSSCRGAFPKMLRRLARSAKDPYKTALKMAAEEIEELRETAEIGEDQCQLALNNSLDRDVKILRQL